MAGISSTLSYSLPLDQSRVNASSRSASAMGVGAIALGAALQINFGQYAPASLALLAIVLCFATLSLTRVVLPSLMTVLSAGLVIQAAMLLIWNPMATLVLSSGATLLPFRIGVVIGCVFALRAIKRDSIGALVGLLLVHFLLGLWVLHAAPMPSVDVAMFQKEASTALLAGRNPYSMTFANPYADAARVYGPGTFANGRLFFGYPYPPLTLLMILPGQVLSDFRLMQLVATTVAGALIAFARPGKVATAAAVLFLSTPRGFFVLEAGWTEPLVVVLLAAVIFLACRGSRWTVVAAALFLVSKQYLIFALPLLIAQMPELALESWWACFSFSRRRYARGRVGEGAVFLQLADNLNDRKNPLPSPRPGLPGEGKEGDRTRARWIVFALLIAAAVTLPIMLWNLPAFMHSVVTLQFHQPMRADALSFLPWVIDRTGAPIPGWIGLVLAAGAIGVAVRTCPKTPAGFATAIAFVFVVFFATNKQAFCNYYQFVIGAMCCAIAASQPGESAETRSTPAPAARD